MAAVAVEAVVGKETAYADEASWMGWCLRQLLEKSVFPVLRPSKAYMSDDPRVGARDKRSVVEAQWQEEEEEW